MNALLLNNTDCQWHSMDYLCIWRVYQIEAINKVTPACGAAQQSSKLQMGLFAVTDDGGEFQLQHKAYEEVSGDKKYFLEFKNLMPILL